MPSSAQTACYSGPSCVYPQPPAVRASMHRFYYKSATPAGGIASPAVPANPPSRTRLVLQESNNHSPSATTRINSPVSSRGCDNARSTHSRNYNTQSNGQTDLMSLSMNSSSSNPHYWPTSSATPQCAVNQSPCSSVSPYAHSTVHTSAATHNFSNNSHYCGINSNATNYNSNGKQNIINRSSTNGPQNKVLSSTGNRPLWKERPHVGRYSLIRTIGKGNFAKVKLAQHLTTGLQVAVKVIDKTLLNHSSMQKLFREVRVLKTLNHPNIIKLLEVIESERHLYLVMEYASGGEVFDYLVSHGKMKESVARIKFRQIVSAVQYCHQKMVVHRDLKAENLLLDEDLNIKIADFGFSNYFCPSQKLDTFCGSPPYAAPELFLGRKYDGPEVDVWSLGVILYTLVSGTLPFDGKNLKELRERVLRGTYRVPFYMTHECEMLLKKMLVLNPAKRLSLTEVMRDPWLNIGFDTILRPFSEPPADYCDPERIETMVRLGFQRHEIQESLTQQRFNNITATYILLSLYNPQVHGRLLGLPSTSGNRPCKPDNRSRHTDFAINGTTQLISNPDTNNVVSSSFPTSRPASAHPLYNTYKAGVRCTPEESLLSKNGSIAIDNSFSTSSHAKKDMPLTQQNSGTSVSSTTASNSSEGTAVSVIKQELPKDITDPNPAALAPRPLPLRRSATTVEPRTNSLSYTKASPETVSGVSIVPKTSHVTPMSSASAVKTECPSVTHRALHYSPASPSVTTAHLTLTNGSVQSSSARLSFTASPLKLSGSRPSSRSSIITAPLAHVEGENCSPIELRYTAKNSNSKGDSRVKGVSCDGSHYHSSSSTTTSSTSSEPDSDSNSYDRECGSGSSGSSVRALPVHTSSPIHVDSKVTSVAVAAAPVLNTTSSLNGTAKVLFQAEHSVDAEPLKSQREDSRFARLPSLHRKWNNRVTADPVIVLSRDSRIQPETSSIDCPATRCTVSVVPAQSSSVKFTDSHSESPKSSTVLDGIGQVQPRGLVRGTPNVADILNEANPFRLTSDALRSQTTTSPSISQGTSSISSTHAYTRAFSPPPSTNGPNNPTPRRPVVPPPLASSTSTTYPNRGSYAYHSLRLPSSTTTTTIAMGKGGRHIESPAAPHWFRGTTGNDSIDTPIPFSASDSREPYSIPFNRNLPERSTIQHVPTGRARERLETPSITPRLVRHPGTHSIANQSMHIRHRSPPYPPESRDPITPRPVSPDDLSISSVISSASTLGQFVAVDLSVPQKNPEDPPAASYSARRNSILTKQSNTLDSPGHSVSKQPDEQLCSNRDGQSSSGLNNFFRSITTRISRSKLFRRSTILQPNDPVNLDNTAGQRNRLDSMVAPTLELDKVVVARGSPSPDGLTAASGLNSARLPRSRSGVTPHRPVSQVTIRHSDRFQDGHHTFRRTPSRKEFSAASVDDRCGLDDIKDTVGRKWSKRSLSSQESRSSRRSTPSGTVGAPDTCDNSLRNVDVSTESVALSRSRTKRSMRYVLKPFAKWQLNDVMTEIKRTLTNHGVDFEPLSESKLQCVYGDPSIGPGRPTDRSGKSCGLSGQCSGEGVVHWEMEVGKLAGVGMNGIRFKRINGSMVTFKQIAKKLAADLRF